MSSVANDQDIAAALNIGAQRSSPTGRDTAAPDPEGRAVQWVLQPRGGPNRRGPQNFRRSVRDGIPLSDCADALGELGPGLRRVFPDGVARLWGSTPTTQTNNPKAVALRKRRVGDEVLFYAEKHFIARARILMLFRSRPLAEAVWGADDETGETWEHVMALGDIEHFKVPAAELLEAVNVTPPLRSLTLVGAEDRLRLLGSLRHLPRAGRTPGAEPEAPGERTAAAAAPSEELLRRLRALRTGLDGDHGAAEEAVALLWAIGRLAAGEERLVPREEFERAVGGLLGELRAPDPCKRAADTYWRLTGSGVWEAEGPGLPGSGTGLRKDVAELLEHRLVRAESVALLRSVLASGQETLLERVGLEGYASAGGNTPEAAGETSGGVGRPERRTGASSRIVRSGRLVEKIKALYDHTCQMCGLRLFTRYGHYSEAAHIQGLGEPHNGSDEESNLLCLCPNHHVQFDRLALYIDTDWWVRRSHDGKRMGDAPLHRKHRIDEKFVSYHRMLCVPPVDVPAPDAEAGGTRWDA